MPIYQGLILKYAYHLKTAHIFNVYNKTKPLRLFIYNLYMRLNNIHESFKNIKLILKVAKKRFTMQGKIYIIISKFLVGKS